MVLVLPLEVIQIQCIADFTLGSFHRIKAEEASMKKYRIGLLLAALIATPALSFAQKAESTAEETTDTAAEGADEENAETVDEGSDEVMEEPDAGGLDEICDLDPEACPKTDFKVEAQKPLNAKMYAMQQVYALRSRRFEIAPSWAVTLNDQFVSHPGATLAANYYINNFWAVGINGTYYEFFNDDSAFNFELRRAARVSVPLTEYQFAAALNVSYVPLYGKLAGFSDFIFHWDSYLVAGGGVVSTRPIPVVDPDNRSFKFKINPAGNIGLGLRVFFNRWLAANLELRDYIFFEKLENLDDGSSLSASERLNESTWYGKKELTNNVQAQIGVSIFLPTSFEYRLPK
jgi:outer membrane beta-barrel protein